MSNEVERALAAIKAARVALEEQDAKVRKDRKCPSALRFLHRLVAIIWDNWLTGAEDRLPAAGYDDAHYLVTSPRKLIRHYARKQRSTTKNNWVQEKICHRLELPSAMAIITELGEVIIKAMEAELKKEVAK